MSRKTLGACASSSSHVIWDPTIYFVLEQMLHLEQVVRANIRRLILNQTPSIHQLTTLRAISNQVRLSQCSGWGLPPSNRRIDDWWQMWLYPSMSSICVYSEKSQNVVISPQWSLCLTACGVFFSRTSSHLIPSRVWVKNFSNFYLKCFLCFYFSRVFKAGCKLDSD